MTGTEMITAALQLLGVLQETEAPSAEQTATSLVALNDLMADLSADGVDVGYAPLSDPTQDTGIAIEERQSLKYILAVYLSPIYGREITPVVGATAISGRNRLLRAAIYAERRPSTMTHVPLGSGRYRRFNVLLGY